MSGQDWYCPSFKKFVHGQEVTYQEFHDECGGGCGFKVYAPSALLDLVYEMLKEMMKP